MPLADAANHIDPGVLDRYLGAKVIPNEGENDRDYIATDLVT